MSDDNNGVVIEGVLSGAVEEAGQGRAAMMMMMVMMMAESREL